MKNAEQMRQPIVLVVPPFQSIARPAMGVSQLKANLEAAGHSTRVVYLNLLFAERIGLERYDWISEATLRVLLGEFVFSTVLFERSAGQIEGYASKWMRSGRFAEQFREAFPGAQAESFLQHLCGEAEKFCREVAVPLLLQSQPWLLGFSSSFQQNCSSLALLRLIKRQRPEILTILGGANCADEMGEELFSHFHELDFLGQGECDHSLVELVDALRNGGDGTGIRGILARGQTGSAGMPRPLLGADLDRLQVPDFKDFFAQLQVSTIRERIRPGLVMETSRGCWWGAKHHCTFCGLNADGMEFRSKSPERALSEIRTLVTDYDLPRVEIVDNILDMKYFKTLLPTLAAQPVCELFFETKANLGRDQVELLARSGVRWIQPGIESLSDHTLKLMRKGATQLQNVQLLKWSAEFGVRVLWNFLAGFPGEDETELPTLGRAMEALHHLAPPGGAGSISMHRFSPYFSDPERWGLTGVQPLPAYGDVYPMSPESIRKIAYIFETEQFEGKSTSAPMNTLREYVRKWQAAHRTSHLLAVARPDALYLLDTRRCATRSIHRLHGLPRELYEYCDRTRGRADIERHFGARATPAQLQSILEDLLEARLLLEGGGRVLALATYAQSSYRKYILFPGGFTLPAAPPPPEPFAQRLRQGVRTLKGPNERVVDAGRRFAKNLYDRARCWAVWRAVGLSMHAHRLSLEELNERLGSPVHDFSLVTMRSDAASQRKDPLIRLRRKSLPESAEQSA